MLVPSERSGKVRNGSLRPAFGTADMSSTASDFASSSEKSLEGDESASSNCVPDFVRMMLSNTARNAVLVTEEAGQWDFPYFEYKRSLQSGSRVARCCRDYQDWLGVLPEQNCFTVAVELLGDFPIRSKRDSEKFGKGKLLVIEHQMDGSVEDLTLPRYAEWKDIRFLSSLSIDSQSSHFGSDIERIFEVAVRYMETTAASTMLLLDPRHRPQWFRKAKTFFLSVLSSDGVKTWGPVSQEHVSSTSTLLRVNSNRGPYYLKSPALGSQETPISVELSSLFPRNTPKVVGTCTELNCFAMKGFTHVDLEEKDALRVVETLGNIQLQSVQYKDRFRKIGCKVRDLQGLLEKVKQWANGEGIFYGCHQQVEEMRQLVPIVTDMCKRLEEFNIPYTLVHGDVALSNATYAASDRKDVILFDWEFACISHPFCDFHRLHKDVTLETVTSYLCMWGAYEDVDRALEAYFLGWKLGWVMKLWSLSDVIESYNPEESSYLQSWIFTILRNLRNSFR